MNKLIIAAGIAVVLLFMLISGYCLYLLNSNSALQLELKAKPNEIRTETKTIVYDSTKRFVYSKQLPTVIHHYYPRTDTILLTRSDSARALDEYYSAVSLCQSYRDSNLSLSIYDTVSRNRIIGRSFSYSLLKPTTYISSTSTFSKPNPKIGLHVGLAAGYSSKFSQGYLVSPYVIMTTKGNSSLLVSYDLMHSAGSIGLALKLR